MEALDHTAAAPALTARRSFEGLYHHALGADPSLMAVLRRYGYDADHPQDHYPASVWVDCLAAACAHLYPDIAPAEGLRRLGRSFVLGFAHTIVGRVLAAAAPVLGPDRVLARIPGYMRVARRGGDVTVQQIKAGHWRLIFESQYRTPDFLCGAVEAVLELTSVQAFAAIVETRPNGYVLEVRW